MLAPTMHIVPLEAFGTLPTANALGRCQKSHFELFSAALTGKCAYYQPNKVLLYGPRMMVMCLRLAGCSWVGLECVFT